MKIIRLMHFLAIEKITFLYVLLTSLIIFYLFPQLPHAYNLLINRILIVTVVIILTFINAVKDWDFIRFLRYVFLGALLSYWYPETFEINRVLPNLDFLLAGWEQLVFGCQPSEVFSKFLPYFWVNEVMNLGYFSYYPFIIGTSIYFYFVNRKYFKFFTFSVFFAFFCFYLIFILFPTAGPQYYFNAIGMENVHAAVFPKIGLFFNSNQTLFSPDSGTGFFNQIVEKTQQVGEKPTAAFPSSHVGISTLIMILVYNNRRYTLLAILTPFYLTLVAATVYIRAHYAIDVLAGLLFAFVFYYFSIVVYQQLTRKYFSVSEFITVYLKEPAVLKSALKIDKNEEV